jgi:HlyD family secretion protein
VKRLLGAALLVAAAACTGKKDKTPPVSTAMILRRDIVIDAQASGAIEPINIIEIKSKASGMITKLPVETGTMVKPGDLLVQVDTRDVKNQFDQAIADLESAQAHYNVSELQKKRSDDMFGAKVITAQEHETAELDLRDANSTLIRDKANVDLAQQRLDDAHVTASIAGTIIEKDVAEGTVIASATGSVSGGTTLLKMADLNQVRIRAFFNETDIGMVRGGQVATVSVDAYQDRKFQGIVEKIEPQAVVQLNVTMFPVLVTLENKENLLKPGMNGEVSVLVSDVPDAIAVPNDAVRSVREVASIASMLNMDPDSATAELKAQQGNGGATKTGTAPGDVALEGAAQQPQSANQQQGSGPRVQVSPAECAAITATIEKHPKEKAKLDDLRAKSTAAGRGTPEASAIRSQINGVYKSIGVDTFKAGPCSRNRNGANGGGVGGSAGSKTGGRGGQAQGAKIGAQGQLQPSGEMPAQQKRKTGLVFVATDSTNKRFAPRVLQLGQGNFDFTEVLSGLNEGDRVVLVSALILQAQRQAANDRTKAQMGVPGLNPNATPAGGRGPGGPGGGGGGGAPARGGRG